MQYPTQPECSLVELEQLRASEEQLRMENEHLRETVTALEQVRDTYFELYDLASVALLAFDHNAIIKNVNRAATVLLGRDRKGLIGHVLHTLVHLDDRSKVIRHLLSCRHLNSSVADLRFRLSQNSVPTRLTTRWVHTSTGAFILAALSVDNEHAQAELYHDQLIESEQQARRQRQSKDRFLELMSQELRAPLTRILDASSKFKEDQTLDAAIRDVFACIDRNACAEARLIDALLDVTGIIQGNVAIVRAPVHLHDLLLECVEQLRHDACHNHHELLVELGALKPWVLGDAERLRQVFTHLLRNAMKFTPLRGSIALRTWNSETQLVIDVQDSGIGFEPEVIARLFEPFEQVTNTPVTGGLGLGLTIVKGLVELHHGRIDAASRGTGQGARFAVQLPTLVQPHSSQPQTSGQEHPIAPGVSQPLVTCRD